MNLKELRAKLSATRARGKAKVDEYEALRGKADLTAEDEAKMAALDAEIDAVEKEVASLAVQMDAEEKRARRAGIFLPAGPAPSRDLATTNEPNPATTGGFRDMSEFAVSVRNAVVNPGGLDQRLAAPTTYHQNGGASGEGYLVPAQYRETIWQAVMDGSDLLSLMTLEPTTWFRLSPDETALTGSNDFSGLQFGVNPEGAKILLFVPEASLAQAQALLPPTP